MAKFIILCADEPQDEEFIFPYYRAQEEFDVKVITIDGKNFKGKYGIPYRGICHQLDIGADIEYGPPKFYISPNIDEITSEDILYLPGGYKCPELLRQNTMVHHTVREMNAIGCLVTSICHGPQVLISSGICKDRKMTCYKGMKDDLINAGADYQEKDVVIDDNIITSPHYNQLPIFMKTIIQHYHLRNSVIH